MNQYDFFSVFWYFHAVLLLSFQGQGTHVYGQLGVLTLIVCGAHNPHESNFESDQLFSILNGRR